MIRSVVDEIVGLFVDDGMLAIALIAWIVLIGTARLIVPLGGAVLPSIFAAGCVTILVGSIVRSSRQSRR